QLQLAPHAAAARPHPPRGRPGAGAARLRRHPLPPLAPTLAHGRHRFARADLPLRYGAIAQLRRRRLARPAARPRRVRLQAPGRVGGHARGARPHDDVHALRHAHLGLDPAERAGPVLLPRRRQPADRHEAGGRVHRGARLALQRAGQQAAHRLPGDLERARFPRRALLARHGRGPRRALPRGLPRGQARRPGHRRAEPALQRSLRGPEGLPEGRALGRGRRSPWRDGRPVGRRNRVPLLPLLGHQPGRAARRDRGHAHDPRRDRQAWRAHAPHRDRRQPPLGEGRRAGGGHDPDDPALDGPGRRGGPQDDRALFARVAPPRGAGRAAGRGGGDRRDARDPGGQHDHRGHAAQGRTGGDRDGERKAVRLVGVPAVTNGEGRKTELMGGPLHGLGSFVGGMAFAAAGAVLLVVGFGLGLALEGRYRRWVLPALAAIIAVAPPLGVLLSGRGLADIDFMAGVDAGGVAAWLLRLSAAAVVGLSLVRVVGRVYRVQAGRSRDAAAVADATHAGLPLLLGFCAYYVGNVLLPAAFGTVPSFAVQMLYPLAAVGAIYMSRNHDPSGWPDAVQRSLLAMLARRRVASAIDPGIATQYDSPAARPP